MTSSKKTKPFEVTKQEVFAAWKRVKANKGAAGVDSETLDAFELKESKNLYKLWNRMSSGSYFPKAVRRVEIPKKGGNKRALGIPTVFDRVAQEVVRARLETVVEPIFHEDSYGYRVDKSALDAVSVCRERNWKFNWVLDVDIQQFFDRIDHELLLKAVRKHSREPLIELYIERWLKAPAELPDGSLEASEAGTPQGGVISPLLANLYLHYAFDTWMARVYPETKFERYADDVIIHCHTKEESEELFKALRTRLEDCGLSLHPEKSQIVYCKDSRRQEDYPNIKFTFLGYTYQPRVAVVRKTGKCFTSFLPSASRESQKNLTSKLRAMEIRRWVGMSIEEVAIELNPTLRGWFNYFSSFYQSALRWLCFQIDGRLLRWARNKYGWSLRRAVRWRNRLRKQQPKLFAHWSVLSRTNG